MDGWTEDCMSYVKNFTMTKQKAKCSLAAPFHTMQCPRADWKPKFVNTSKTSSGNKVM